MLLPALRNRTGIEVQVMSMGTGRALAIARNGDCDAVLVHAESEELKFVREGWATVNIDSQSAVVICELLDRLRHEHGTTVVYTTPSDSLLESITQRVVRLDAGRVQEDGC